MHRGGVLTIGNFDGVHLGHQAVLRSLAQTGRQLGAPSVLMTFEPQPQEFFAPETAPPRLTRLREKLVVLESCGIDAVLCLRFNDALAKLEAEDFITQLLVERFAARHVLVGDDFRFGRQRRGDVKLLTEMGAANGFRVGDMPTFELNGERVSSTRVRRALSDGRLDDAAELLGRPYRLYGRVVHGDGRGRTIGFPTANIELRRRTLPLLGVYAVRVNGLGERTYNGAANFGVRPTFGGRRAVLEVHLLDFAGDAYGKNVSVEIVDKLRDEQRFDSVDALTRQITDDVGRARDRLACS